MNDDTPTLRLPEPANPGTPAPRPSARQSRAPFIAFVIVAVLVVAASAALVYVLIGRAPSQNATGPTDPASSASTPVQSVAPLAPGQFTSFVTPASQRCDGHGKHQRGNVEIAWATQDATQVWVVEGTGDAASAGLTRVPTSGDQDSFPAPLPLDCSRRSMTFTMTLVGDDGGHVSRSWTVEIDSKH